MNLNLRSNEFHRVPRSDVIVNPVIQLLYERTPNSFIKPLYLSLSTGGFSNPAPDFNELRTIPVTESSYPVFNSLKRYARAIYSPLRGWLFIFTRVHTTTSSSTKELILSSETGTTLLPRCLLEPIFSEPPSLKRDKSKNVPAHGSLHHSASSANRDRLRDILSTRRSFNPSTIDG